MLSQAVQWGGRHEGSCSRSLLSEASVGFSRVPSCPSTWGQQDVLAGWEVGPSRHDPAHSGARSYADMRLVGKIVFQAFFNKKKNQINTIN